MAQLILPSRRVVQPQGPVEIDWANPLARGLVSLIAIVDGTPVELVQRRVLTRAGNAKVAAGKRGRAAVTSADGDYYTTSLATIPATGFAGLSWFAWSRIFADEAGVRKRAVRWANSTSGTIAHIEYNAAEAGAHYVGVQDAAGSFPQTKVTVGGLTVTEPHFVAGNYPMSGGDTIMFLDGARPEYQAPSGSSNGLRANIDQVWLGANTTSLSLRGEVYLAGLYSRQLSAAEHRELASNPWQLLRPVQRKVWVPASAAPVNVTLDAAGLSVASASADLALQVPLAGGAVSAAVAAGQLTLTVQLQAAAVAVQKALGAAGQAQAGGSAALQVSGGSAATLGAAALAQAGGSASLNLVLGLGAGALGRAGGAANLWLQVPLSAAALEQVSASASVLLTVQVSAAAVATAASGASLKADFRLQASAQAVAVAGAMLTIASLFASAPPGFGYARPVSPVVRPHFVGGSRPSMRNTRR